MLGIYQMRIYISKRYCCTNYPTKG